MRKFLVIAVLPLLVSCRATMETQLSKSDPNAPLNEINGGVVSYLNQGHQSVIASRRRDAYKKMHERCQGDYNIVEEGEKAGDGMAVPVGGTLLYGQQREWTIKFACAH